MMKNIKGASLVEYGLLVGLIAVASIVAVTTLGANIANLFDTVGDKLSGVAGQVSAF